MAAVGVAKAGPGGSGYTGQQGQERRLPCTVRCTAHDRDPRPIDLSCIGTRLRGSDRLDRLDQLDWLDRLPFWDRNGWTRNALLTSFWHGRGSSLFMPQTSGRVLGRDPCSHFPGPGQRWPFLSTRMRGSRPWWVPKPSKAVHQVRPSPYLRITPPEGWTEDTPWTVRTRPFAILGPKMPLQPCGRPEEAQM